MKLPLAKKITLDQVPNELQGFVSTLSFILNPFMSNVVDLLNGRLGFENFDSRLAIIDVKTDANGNIMGIIDINTGLGRVPAGQICVNVVDSTNSNKIPNITGTPFVLYTPLSGGNIRISKILNLGSNANYTLTIWFL